MINKLEIASMVFEGVSRSISVAPKYCSKIKHKSAPCTLCYTLCPVEDIHIGGPGETITVEWDKCTGCGLCVERCPIKPVKAIYIIPKNMPDAETAGYYNYLKRIGKK